VGQVCLLKELRGGQRLLAEGSEDNSIFVEEMALQVVSEACVVFKGGLNQ
jgi:hypothetical protein